MIKLAVFDWNATLLSDTKENLEADNHVLKTFGGRQVSLKQYQDTFDIPAIDFYVKHGCDRQQLTRESKRLGQVFHEFYEPRAVKCRTRKGAKQLLEWLMGKKIPAIILSNHTVEGINSQLARLGLQGQFTHIVANSELETAMKERNKLEKLRKYLNEQGYKANEAVIIGDSPEEVHIGKELGLKTIAIKHGFYSTARLKKAQPDYLVGALGGIRKIIEGR